MRCTVILAVLLSLSGTVVGQGGEVHYSKNLYFQILTQDGPHHSTLFVLNPFEYEIVGEWEEHPGPNSTATHSPDLLNPNAWRSIFPEWQSLTTGPQDWRCGWAIFKYRFRVPADEKERGESLRLLGWTRLILLERERQGPHIQEIDPTNPVIAVANIPTVEAALEFKVPGILRSEPRRAEAAISILNPWRGPVQIEVTLFYQDAKRRRDAEDVQITNRLELPYSDRLSRFVWELMTKGKDDPPERATELYRSTLHIRGSAPIAVGALLYYPNGVFGTLPVVSVDP